MRNPILLAHADQTENELRYAFSETGLGTKSRRTVLAQPCRTGIDAGPVGVRGTASDGHVLFVDRTLSDVDRA